MLVQPSPTEVTLVKYLVPHMLSENSVMDGTLPSQKPETDIAANGVQSSSDDGNATLS